MADPEAFLRRWSRRKRAVPEDEIQEAPAEPGAGELTAEAPAEEVEPAESAAPEAEEDTETLISRLPDIDTLTDKTDFRPFMDPRIPDALRNRALRKLWRTNPVFANLDGLNDYDEDYTDAAMVVPGLKTAYQVGRGIVRKALDLPPEAEAEAEAEIASADNLPAGDQPPEPDVPVIDEASESEPGDDPAPDPRNKMS